MGDLMHTIESKEGPGPILLILTLPVLLPLPPGVSMILALPLVIVAPQLILGRRKLWLPDSLANRTVKREALFKLLKRVLPLLERIETLVRPRLLYLTGRLGARLIGVACSVIALVLVLPLPFANLLPAIAMSIFAVGLSRRDGLAVLAGYGLLALSVVIIDLGVHGARFGIDHLHALMSGLLARA